MEERIQRLEKLARLLEKGAITHAEFEAQKTATLERAEHSDALYAIAGAGTRNMASQQLRPFLLACLLLIALGALILLRPNSATPALSGEGNESARTQSERLQSEDFSAEVSNERMQQTYEVVPVCHSSGNQPMRCRNEVRSKVEWR